MRKRAVINNHAPKCALPGCNNRVGFHKTYKKANTTVGAKWKMFCEPHRGSQKIEVDNWKMKNGCSNTTTKYGFVCTAHIIGPEQLDVHHIDGNRHNSDAENLDVLCRNCHAHVTIQNNDHLTRYDNAVDLDPNMWEPA